MNEMLGNFLRVRAYLRYSTVMQDDGFSVEYQMNEIKDYLDRKGMELQRAHIDKAQTATKVAGRDAFHELVRDVKEGLVDIIVVYKMNRMFRNSEESEYYRRIFRKNGVKLISVTEHIDDDTSTGRLTTSILSNIDQYQADVISDHVRAGLREMAKQGLYTGRPLLIGYGLAEEKHGKKKRKKFIISEEEAPFIERIFNLYANGKSVRQIGKILKTEGIKTRRGYNFSEQTLRRMLKNDFYTGVYRYKVEGYEEIVIEDGVPAIISKELFEAVQRRMKANDPLLKPKHRKRLYALTGKIVCGKCGSNYVGTNSFVNTVKNGMTHYNYYTCTNRKEFKMCNALNVRKEWLEEEVMKEIRRLILSEEQIIRLSNEISELCQNSPATITDEISRLKSDQLKVEKQYNKFVAAFFDEEETDNSLAQKTMQQLKAQLKDIEKQLSILTEQLRYSITPESIQEYLHSMLKYSNADALEAWYEIYNNFVDKIIVTDDDIQIELTVYPADNLRDKESLALPIVSLSAILHRLAKYRPKKFY